jgi:hypothetical protein
MEDKEREQLIEEIRKLERELYLKRSKLRELSGVDVKELERVIDELISQIGMISIGGNSVEDIRVERGRCNIFVNWIQKIHSMGSVIQF